MVKSIIISKNGGPEVLELKDVKIGSPGPEEIKIKNRYISNKSYEISHSHRTASIFTRRRR